MEILYFLLTVIAVVIVVVVVKLVRYGGFHQAFDSGLAADRKALDEARRDAGQAEKARKAELAKAEKELSKARASYDRGIWQATQRVEAVENPGLGRRLARLGPVDLHEHAVVLESKHMPLSGLQARVETVKDTTSYLYLRLASGHEEHHGFSTAWRATSDIPATSTNPSEHDGVAAPPAMERDFSDEQVRRFCTDINNATVAERDFVEKLPAVIAQARADLAAAQAATEPVTDREQNLARIRAGSPLADAAAAAQIRRAEAEKAWRAKTNTATPADGQ
ncbi:hypothetical protein [Actinoplanes missouriensis]|uniref:hypothetical protein n=1 Tax=Actinoplanes missouriensis TaxID=1866 RepID=UPI0036801392